MDPITFENAAEALFCAAMSEELEGNSIETPEVRKLFDAFYDAVIEPIEKKDVGKANDAYEALAEMATEYARSGFRAGLRMAFALQGASVVEYMQNKK